MALATRPTAVEYTYKINEIENYGIENFTKMLYIFFTEHFTKIEYNTISIQYYIDIYSSAVFIVKFAQQMAVAARPTADQCLQIDTLRQATIITKIKFQANII